MPQGRTFTEITEQEIRLAPEKKRGSIPWLSAFNGFKCTKYSVLNTHNQLIKFFGMLGKV